MVLLNSSIYQTGAHFLGLNPQNHPFSGIKSSTPVGIARGLEVSDFLYKAELRACPATGKQADQSFWLARNRMQLSTPCPFLSSS